MKGVQNSDAADRAARDVARLFNKPGLRHLVRLARAENSPPRPESVVRCGERAMRTA